MARSPVGESRQVSQVRREWRHLRTALECLTSSSPDQWTARMPTADEAAVLELPAGAAVLHVIHTARDENGDGLEVSESIWPADCVVMIDDYDIEQEPVDPAAPGEV
ncbi:UTRA domain-containing protein [Actinophytocola sediminis]